MEKIRRKNIGWIGKIVATDVGILLIAAVLWACLAPGIAIVVTHDRNGARVGHLVMSEFNHEYDAAILWLILVFIAGTFIAWINYRLFSMYTPRALFASIAIAIVGIEIIEFFVQFLSIFVLKLHSDPLVKSIPPRPIMGALYHILGYKLAHIDDISLLGWHYDATSLVMHIQPWIVVSAGISLGYFCVLFSSVYNEDNNVPPQPKSSSQQGESRALGFPEKS